MKIKGYEIKSLLLMTAKPIYQKSQLEVKK
jgi:hypothetical protein